MVVYETWGQLEHEIPPGKAAFYVIFFFCAAFRQGGIGNWISRTSTRTNVASFVHGSPREKEWHIWKRRNISCFLSPWAFSVCATKSKKNRCLVSRTSRTNIEPRKLVSGGRRRYFHVEVV